MSQQMTLAEYEQKKKEILDRKDISPILRTVFLNSLKRRYENDVEYYKPDASGFSKADYDALAAQRKDLEWKAIKLGMEKDKVGACSNLILTSFVSRQLFSGKTIKYDESELGSPDFEKYDGTDYR